MNKFFDSHIHLHFLKNDSWKKEENWVFNNVSTTMDDLSQMSFISAANKNVYMTVGIHPLEVDNFELSDVMEELDRFIKANRSRVVAIGETGLDFYKADKEESFEKQKRWLYSHYNLAKKHNLPLVLHVRNAHEEILDILTGIMDWYGVIHCFEADAEITEKYLDLPQEWLLSVSPVVLRDTSLFRHYLHKIDVKRLLVESDAPFLGDGYSEINKLIELIAEEKKMKFEDCKSILWDNFCRIFKLNR